MAYDNYGDWLNWREGEGPATPELGRNAGFAGFFSPEIQAALGLPGMGSMTAEDYARAASKSGVSFSQTRGDGGAWVNAIKDGSPTGDKVWTTDTPGMGMFELIPYLVGGLGIAGAAGLLGGMGGTAAGGAAGGGAAGTAAGGLADAGILSAAQVAEIGSMAANPLATFGLDAALMADIPTLASLGAGTAGAAGIGTFGGMPEIGNVALDPISRLPAADVAAMTAPAGGVPSIGGSVKTFGGMPGIGETPAPITPNSPLPASITSSLASLGGATSGIPGLLKDYGGTLAPLIGGALGASEAGKSTTSTSQAIMDPRMQAMLYGSGPGDANSVFGAAQKLWQDNPSGINPTMQQGMDMSRAALTDPAYAQGYQQMRNIGSGLLNMTPAGNPFTQGGGPQMPQMPQMQQGGNVGLLPFADRAKALMAQGRGLLGQ